MCKYKEVIHVAIVVAFSCHFYEICDKGPLRKGYWANRRIRI